MRFIHPSGQGPPPGYASLGLPSQSGSRRVIWAFGIFPGDVGVAGFAVAVVAAVGIVACGFTMEAAEAAASTGGGGGGGKEGGGKGEFLSMFVVSIPVTGATSSPAVWGADGMASVLAIGPVFALNNVSGKEGAPDDVAPAAGVSFSATKVSFAILFRLSLSVLAPF